MPVINFDYLLINKILNRQTTQSLEENAQNYAAETFQREKKTMITRIIHGFRNKVRFQRSCSNLHSARQGTVCHMLREEEVMKRYEVIEYKSFWRDNQWLLS